MRTTNNKLNNLKNKKFTDSLSKLIKNKIIINYKFIEESKTQFSPDAIELVSKFGLIISKKLLNLNSKKQQSNTSQKKLYITTDMIYQNAEKYLKGELKYHSLHQSRKVFITNKPIKNNSNLKINFKIFNYLLPKNISISNIAATSLAYILEYILTELLELASNQVNNIIFPEDIVSTIVRDYELKYCIN